MASARFAWGIDVGNRALKAVKLINDGGVLKVDDFELIEHETVLSNAGDNREALIQTALANFVQRHPNMKGGVVSVGVSGQQSFARFIKLPPVEAKKIPEIVRFEAIQQIPFPLDDVEWSYQLFQQVESPDIEVGIFAMRKELVNRHIGAFTDFDLNVQVVQMNPLAVYNAMHADGRLDGTTMIIDLGAENTDLIIADNETVWLRSIPIGGNNFTETLVKAFKLPFNKAEDLKRNAQTSKYARQIFQAMRPVFADLVAEIQRSIGFYSSVHRDSRIKKIIALGGTFRLPGLQKYLQQNLQIDVEKLDALGSGAPTDSKIAGPFAENLSSVVGAYGLALQAMGQGKITSSLLPATIRRERMWQEKTKWFAAAAALFVAGAGLAFGKYFLENVQFNSAQPDRDAIQNVESKANSLDKRWEEVASAGGQEKTDVKNVMGLFEYREVWQVILKDLVDAVPKPQETLAVALTKGDAAQIKSIERGKRTLVQLDSLASKYVYDIGPVLDDPNFARWAGDDVTMANPKAAAQPEYGGGGAVGGPQGFIPPPPPPPPPGGAGGFVPDAPQAVRGGPAPGTGGVYQSKPQTTGVGAAGQRGFLLTLRCTSPNAEAPNLIEVDFLKNLLALIPNSIRQHMPYATSKVVIVSSMQIKYDKTRMQKLRDAYNAAMMAKQAAEGAAVGRGASMVPGGIVAPPPPPMNAFMGGAVPRTGAAVVDDSEPFKDRVTGEDVRNDWEFTILMAIVLNPPDFKPPAVVAPSPQASAATP